MPGKGPRTGADMRRAAAVLLLIAIAVVGLRAGGAFSGTGSPGALSASGRVLYWILVVTVSALLLVGVAAIVLRLITGGQGLPPRRKRSQWWLLLLPVFVVGLSRALAVIHAHHAGESAAGGDGSGAHGGPSHLLPPGRAWPLLVALAVVALAAAALMTSSRRARPRRPAPKPVAAPPATPPPAPLAAAVAAGAQALQGDPDPRAAIVRCYAAMEHTLTGAGSPPSAADTPAEVLDRATADGLILPAAAGTLTGLFRRARYSTHPVTEDDRAEALRALDRLRATLEGPA